MTLLKPTRRDFVRTAADGVRASLRTKAKDTLAEAHALRDKAQALRQKAAAQVTARQVSKLQPLADKLNAVAKKAGYGEPFSVSANYEHNKGPADSRVVVSLLYKYDSCRVVTETRYPQDTDAIKKMDEEAQQLIKESNRLQSIARNLEDQDVISGSINAALNGEAAAALQTLVDNIKEVVLTKVDELRLADR